MSEEIARVLWSMDLKVNKNQHGTWLGIVSACREHSNQKLKLISESGGTGR